MSEDVVKLPIDALQPNPLQPRGVISPESLADLVDSIKTHGVIQPLVIAHTPAGYQIIAGERRWRASKLAGLTEVPVVIMETTPQGMLEMAIVENVQRSDLNPVDRAKSFNRLMIEFRLSNADIAKRIGKSPAYISNTLRLLELPDALKDGLISGVISEGHARALSAIPDTQQMIEAYKIILREGGSVRRAEELSRRFKKIMNVSKSIDGFNTKTVNELIDRMAADLKESLGRNSQVKIRRSRVETAVHIVLRGNPEETEGQIQRIYQSLAGRESYPEVETKLSESVTPSTSPKIESATEKESEVNLAAEMEGTEDFPDLDLPGEDEFDSPYTNPFEPIPDSEDDFED